MAGDAVENLVQVKLAAPVSLPPSTDTIVLSPLPLLLETKMDALLTVAGAALSRSVRPASCASDDSGSSYGVGWQC